MKTQSTNKPHRQKKTGAAAKSNYMMWVVIIVIMVASMGIAFWRNYTAGKIIKDATTIPSVNNVPATPFQDLLIGRWVRTDSDGNYILEIKSATPTGNLEANYFNPHPIKVGHSEWQKKNGGVVIIVELRDVNYPGSTYTLYFHPSENRLTGRYYQAVEGTTYDVAFVRIP